MNARLAGGGVLAAMVVVVTLGAAVAVGAGGLRRADAGTSGGKARHSGAPAASGDRVAEGIAALRQKGAADPAPKTRVNPNLAAGAPLVAQEPPLPDGAVSMGGGWFFTGSTMSRPPSDIADTFSSSWSAFGAGQNVDVWAGASGSDPSQGIVLVVVWNDDRSSVTGGAIISSPKATGTLRIVSASGLMLDLVSADGSSYTLDPIAQTLK